MIASIWKACQRFADALNALSAEAESIAQEVRQRREFAGAIAVNAEPPKIATETPPASRRKASA